MIPTKSEGLLKNNASLQKKLHTCIDNCFVIVYFLIQAGEKARKLAICEVIEDEEGALRKEGYLRKRQP